MVRKNFSLDRLMFENRFLRIMDRLYGWLISIGSNLQSLFLLYMRLVWGHQFFYAGAAKLTHIDVVAQFFTSLNLSHPTGLAYTVAVIEAIGGICLFFGFASRLIAIPLVIVMTSALSIAHREAFAQFHFLFDPSILVHQAPYPYLLTALLVFVFGPGRVSIDAWIKRRVNKCPKF